jgi:hypothetical protein
MSTHDTFATDVIREFQFLEEEYGMRREPPASSEGAFWMAYGNVNVKVIIEHERGGSCGVTVQNLRHVKRDPLERNEFDLEEIMAVAAPPRQSGGGNRRPDPRPQPMSVAKAAQTLRTVGASTLKGDFEALHERQKKAVEVLRHHHPLQDKEPAP